MHARQLKYAETALMRVYPTLSVPYLACLGVFLDHFLCACLDTSLEAT